MARTPLAAIGLLTPAPRGAATTTHQLSRAGSLQQIGDDADALVYPVWGEVAEAEDELRWAGTMATASYTAYGERSGSTYKMPGGVYTRDLVYRDDATRRVKRTTIERESVAGTVSDRAYDYDDAGNITSIADTPEVGQADTQCFRQDPLGRLASAWTPKSGVSCETDPTVANVGGGPAAHWQDWTFDSTGSRLTETGHTAAGDTTRNYTLPTGGQGVVRPHAVTEMITTPPGQPAVVSQYGYDRP